MTFSTTYHNLASSILAISEGETDEISLMATMACELFHGFDHFDWVGFYRNVGDETLKIGPYQGGHGCLVIPFGRGVCGACAKSETTVIVPDVDAFADHIACSSSTKSEIVLPVFNKAGELLAVLDIDSDRLDAFDEEDRENLESLLGQVFSTAT